MNKKFDNVTILEKNRFFVEDENGLRRYMTDIIPVVGSSARAFEVYSFKLANASVSKNVLFLDYAFCDSIAFSSAYRAYWYYLEREKIEGEYTEYKNAVTDTDDENDKARFEVVTQRYNDAMKALAEFAKLAVSDETVKNLVRADRRLKLELYPAPIVKAFAGVATALDAAEKLDADDKGRDLTQLKKALDALCKCVWVPSEICKKFTFKANNRLAENVWRVYYDGEARDKKTGKHVCKRAKSSKVIGEVVLACFHELQEKTLAREKTASETPAETTAK